MNDKSPRIRPEIAAVTGLLVKSRARTTAHAR